MRWEDERYVRVYIRDTVEWEMLPWQSRALWPLLLRKLDRAGLLDMGKHGVRGLAALVKLPEEVVGPGLAGLIDDGCVEQHGTQLVVPNFIAAQDTPSSDKQRAKEYRERRRLADLEASRSVTKRDEGVTKSDATITENHEPSHVVTERHSVLSDPFRSVPSVSPSEGVAGAPPASEQGSFALEAEEPAEDAGKAAQREMTEAVSHYQRRWVEVFQPADGLPPKLSEGDRGQLRAMLKAHGLATWKDYLERFLADDDPRLATDGYALALMTRRLNGYRVTKKPGRPGKGGSFAPSANFAESGDKTSEYT